MCSESRKGKMYQRQYSVSCWQYLHNFLYPLITGGVTAFVFLTLFSPWCSRSLVQLDMFFKPWMENKQVALYYLFWQYKYHWLSFLEFALVTSDRSCHLLDQNDTQNISKIGYTMKKKFELCSALPGPSWGALQKPVYVHILLEKTAIQVFIFLHAKCSLHA